MRISKITVHFNHFLASQDGNDRQLVGLCNDLLIRIISIAIKGYTRSFIALMNVSKLNTLDQDWATNIPLDGQFTMELSTNRNDDE